MLYVPLDFENIPTVDAQMDSGAIVSAITQNDMDTKIEKAPNNILNRGSCQFSDTSSQWTVRKTIMKTTVKLELGDKTFAELFVVMRKLTGPIIGLNLMRN